jgi:hypothetical protein
MKNPALAVKVAALRFQVKRIDNRTQRELRVRDELLRRHPLKKTQPAQS